ncbi:unnamed protein product [Phaeothamnion confervicola]
MAFFSKVSAYGAINGTDQKDEETGSGCVCGNLVGPGSTCLCYVSRGEGFCNEGVKSSIQELKAKRLSSVHIDTIQKQNASLAHFYRRQNEVIDFIVKSSAEGEAAVIDQQEEDDVAEAERLAISLALMLSFSANVVLCVIKAVALGMSSSMAVLASLMDSVLDLVSGGILYGIERAKAMPDDKYDYPVGKNRLEPVGVLVFAMVMGTAAFEVVIESATELVEGIGGNQPDVSFDTAVQILTGIVIVTKLMLWRYCSWVAERTGSSAVEAYAQDHFNDTVTNIVGVMGLALGALVSHLWWADPVAAILLAGFIISNWGATALEEAGMIVGKTASPHLMQQLTYTVVAHDTRILFVDTVRAFHFGHMFLVEVDIVLPPEMKLNEAHDIGESLQFKLEALDVVERAYVHLDYEYAHKPEH